ncbi:MAG: LPS export ABC transporter ATP-binding protein [Caldiserica bacterium]|nr:MAG: LPS export ABC transporter ATP-binding protein [Caldisericota bacterium]
MLEAKGIRKFYGKREVVKGVDIILSTGEVVGLLGPNGAGKTTIFYSIMGVVKPEEGRVFVDGKEITDFPLYKRAREGIAYLAQEPSIFRGLTVEENLEAILEFIIKDRGKIKERREQLLKELGLEKVRKIKAYNLSGGEKRRVEVARVLATNPKYLLLDEPFVGIDPKTIDELQRIIWSLRKRNIGILITDHNVRDTLEVIDRAYIIYDGKILFKGKGEELLESKEVRRFYLGEKFKV